MCDKPVYSQHSKRKGGVSHPVAPPPHTPPATTAESDPPFVGIWAALLCPSRHANATVIQSHLRSLRQQDFSWWITYLRGCADLPLGLGVAAFSIVVTLREKIGSLREALTHPCQSCDASSRLSITLCQLQEDLKAQQDITYCLELAVADLRRAHSPASYLRMLRLPMRNIKILWRTWNVTSRSTWVRQDCVSSCVASGIGRMANRVPFARKVRAFFDRWPGAARSLGNTDRQLGSIRFNGGAAGKSA